MQCFTRRFLAACAFSGIVASTGALAEGHPTIRAMSGAMPVSELPAGKSALLVIDFQNEYFTGRMPIPDGAKALANTRELIKYADSHKMPVYHVQHVAPAGSAVFAIDGETVKFHPDMMPRAKDTVVQKSTVSVFASTDLDKRLKSAGIENLIISGLMTHACVAGAARDAAPLGYKVIVASDASATRDITRVNGDKVDKDALHKAALAEVEDTFGDVMTTAQILKLPVR
ncbi:MULTISPECIES: cysteine hydrolase family protein [Pseudomonas]|uniref:cysteine hydrolase family protein n=1 Tax=Pseudomonas TaxID=286 RepID=UPI0007B3EA9B|nr:MULTISPECIES: isochorismatase family protein [Pseudomonas]AZC52049.1 Isochorismatase [Pseudomonas chlororaphis subsp. piscium]AZC58489.1 Isochorismatase [Pseudomonas chlororaphis subsp. piscium]AZC64715.1 Isochorismatase [Pseudomonas chlororaphis subsp. piscium]AZC70955.1 Isochorismatase [Pseudomonas chlororaphis subsp. piscium]AZC77181.1 Isochorismatase [Pseudomonas chlororaphis subsp. piscium]